MGLGVREVHKRVSGKKKAKINKNKGSPTKEEHKNLGQVKPTRPLAVAYPTNPGRPRQKTFLQKRIEEH